MEFKPGTQKKEESAANEVGEYVKQVSNCKTFDEVKGIVDQVKSLKPEWFSVPVAEDMVTDADLLTAVIVKVEGLYYDKISDPSNTTDALEEIKREIHSGETWASKFISEARKRRFDESFEALITKLNN